MSEQQFVDCDTANDHGCEGGLMDYAFEFAENHSICSEDSYSYKGVDESCPSDLETTCDVCVKKGDVTGFKDVKSNDVDSMVQAISEGPVSVAIEADQSVFQFYKSGVVTSDECGENLDHGVLAVGYGTDDDGTEYWLVKNSWGETWADSGYVKIAKALNSDGESECGILSQPSYPVIATQQQAALQATQSAFTMAKEMATEKLFI
jgi:cathepsin L